VRADIEDLDAAIATYRARFGAAPHTLQDLVRTGIVSTVPQDPDGKSYAYDAAVGRVSSTAARVLGS